VRQASNAGGNAAYNINTGLGASSNADPITLDMNHPLLATVKHEQFINRRTFGNNQNPVKNSLVAR
jgi:hypothetical protein